MHDASVECLGQFSIVLKMDAPDRCLDVDDYICMSVHM